jgi:hypothetical protein
MEKSQGNSLYSYVIQTKMSFFKNGDRKVKQVLSWHQCGGGGYKERVWEVNMVEYYVLMYENGKMRPVETIPGMGEGIKENDGGDEFNYYIL